LRVPKQTRILLILGNGGNGNAKSLTLEKILLSNMRIRVMKESERSEQYDEKHL